jgi:hypothetical protein
MGILMVQSILVVQIDLMGWGGGQEWGVDEIGEGVSMIGHGGGWEFEISRIGGVWVLFSQGGRHIGVIILGWLYSLLLWF